MTTTPDGPVDDTWLDPANTGPDVDPDTGLDPETAKETDPGPMPGEDPGAI